MSGFPDPLLSGYLSFRAGDFPKEKSRYETLARMGQKPKYLIIACCDSRAAPETVFNAHPGELFVIRNVANLVPPHGVDDGFHSTSAAIEFAVTALKVSDIVVMGHAKCGGIAAALNPDMEPLSPGNFVGKWIDIVKPVAHQVAENADIEAEEKQTVLEQLSIRNSIENLRKFPFVSELEQRDELRIHGAWFDIALAELWTMDGKSGAFVRAPKDN